jgi:glyoxylase-like metal-dependent hydrolase (beta-lactamase superfamily II)
MECASATEWYRLIEMGDGVTLIEEPHIKPFYRCNMWHVRGRDRDMLVDTGMGVVSLCAQVSMLTERPIVAIASHTHFDHIGCHGEFEERVVHWAEADLLAHPTRANTLADSYVSLDMFTMLPPEPFDPETYTVPAAPATRIVDDGDIIDMGDRQFEVIHTPGHSPGSIGLWEAATGVFIAGDIVYEGPLVEDAYHSDMNDYIASMERILQLPVRIVHGGHFDSFGYNRYCEIIETWLAEKKAGS